MKKFVAIFSLIITSIQHIFLYAQLGNNNIFYFYSLVKGKKSLKKGKHCDNRIDLPTAVVCRDRGRVKREIRRGM